jgi:hypothetical protein
MRLAAAACAALAVLVASPGPTWPQSAVARARQDLVRSAREYRASLEALLPSQEREVEGAQAQLSRFTDLWARGLVSRRDVEDAAGLVASARARVETTHRAIGQAAAIIAETEAGALGPGAAPIVWAGARAWSLRELGSVERFFRARFGRALPVSALGQTPVHDRLGFDHHQAVDVAVHPDTAEGRALMAWLRVEGVPFIAYRGAVTGAATGAHVHIGRPSDRRVSGRF